MLLFKISEKSCGCFGDAERYSVYKGVFSKLFRIIVFVKPFKILSFSKTPFEICSNSLFFTFFRVMDFAYPFCIMFLYNCRKTSLINVFTSPMTPELKSSFPYFRIILHVSKLNYSLSCQFQVKSVFLFLFLFWYISSKISSISLLQSQQYLDILIFTFSIPLDRLNFFSVLNCFFHSLIPHIFPLWYHVCFWNK